ncbi:MAG: FAD-dependent thymidylate synthase [Vampirovibrionales bacterium]|nr:FAD-dependent thymidylate synthase [Vampirovibrionales bacterium]
MSTSAVSEQPAASAMPDANASPALIRALDHGFVERVDAMGSDLTVVNSARVSFGKRKDALSAQDEKLIRYLAAHKHWSPFRHVQIQFHCKVPEFVARQWYKHVVGIAYSEAPTVDHAWNEISQRYVDAGEFDFYTPDGFRQQSSDNKQASTDDCVPDPGGELMRAYAAHCRDALALYQRLTEAGAAREQARGALPLSIYTEFYWTASLQAIVNFIQLRKHPGAQYEIRVYADAIETLTRQVAPLSLQGLLGDAPPSA